MKRIMSLIISMEISLIFPGMSNLLAQNPIMQDISTADPAALVYGDSVYIYAGADEEHFADMYSYYVLSSADMVNWKNHGKLLSIADFEWAASQAWAGHCIESDGKFYWYVPMMPKSDGKMYIGVAVGNSPTGPFADAIGAPLVEGFDPAVFIDEDGQAYIYSGAIECVVMKLKDNMIEIEGTASPISVPDYFEAPYMHERNGIYYFTYCSTNGEIVYATGNSPMGPFTYQSRLNGPVTASTNHHSIIEFKGQWYFIYHIRDEHEKRSTAIDYLYYFLDGSMQEIVQTSEGVNLATGIELQFDDAMSVNNENLFNIYPNPSYNDEITIDLSQLVNPRYISIIDINGNMVYHNSKLNNKVTQLVINLYPSVYFVKVLTNNEIYNRKLIVY